MTAILAAASVLAVFVTGFVLGSIRMRSMMADAFVNRLKRMGVSAEEWNARGGSKR